jgi:hypothetical protein
LGMEEMDWTGVMFLTFRRSFGGSQKSGVIQPAIVWTTSDHCFQTARSRPYQLF